MTKRSSGVAFMAISAFLIATKYVSAAILNVGSAEWSHETFGYMLSYVGNTLSNLSLLSLLVGIGYLIWGEKELLSKSKP